MAAYVVWLDHENAKLFKMQMGSIDPTHIRKHATKHHTAHESQTSHNNPADETFYHGIARSLEKADEILIVGPGLAKDHFRTHLEKHHHANVLKKVVGCETVNHPTDAQIVAHARNFFKMHDPFRAQTAAS